MRAVCCTPREGSNKMGWEMRVNVRGVVLGTVGAVVMLALAALLLAADGSKAAFPGTKGKIALGRETTGSDSTDIIVMNADGSGQVNLTNTPEPLGERQPAFSPDGKLIAFSQELSGEREIFVMNADGSGQVNLTNTPVPLREADPA